ncbi:28S ribosomal protein S21, mitochondrial [Aplysia californica]|uniref:28S ribosomal protein S21, mitochondrial n=1 Tax=Aplysia californica TaxID=6500 RepID=A0ABM0JNS1_APLCA|nr:28S ribosomal protein S21, mitochondrial [Aplysia californica]
MSSNHLRFLAKTVLVRNNQIEPAYRILDGILKREQFFSDVKRKERFEKPFLKRSRLSYERARRIYDSEMQRKIEFVMRKNRPDPFLR